MDWRDRINKLAIQLNEIMSLKPMKMNKGELPGIKTNRGDHAIYIITDHDDKRVLYVGKSKRLHQRIQYDLLTNGRRHPFKSKFLQETRGKYDIMSYLTRCCLRTRYIAKPDVDILERFAIIALDPTYNSQS